MMEEPQKKRPLLFINADTRNPTTQRRNRDRSLDSQVRRHLMVDIGKTRRKASKTAQFGTIIWSLEEKLKTLSSTGQGERSKSRDVDHMQVPAKYVIVPDTAAQYNALHIATPPILHALSVFEKEWGEDWFSAYGFTLIMVAGRNAMSGSACSSNTFWFPFAFKNSAFLHHYQQIFTSPNVLVPLYSRSARQLRSLALERSLETIQCVESRISSSDASSATSDSVLQAVLALVCFNFTSLDFDQAMIHVKGMWMVVEARGGISTLKANQDLLLMISWYGSAAPIPYAITGVWLQALTDHCRVDITAALLHHTKPLFPLIAPIASVTPNLGLETLPAPLLSIINDENSHDTRLLNVMSSIGNLNALATLIRHELATNGNAIWHDGQQIGFVVNPITHRLLNQSSRSNLVTRWDTISEALRLGAIIWIIQMKRRCRSYPGTAEARISTLLEMLLGKSIAEDFWDSPDLRLVRLWLLVLCSISEPSDKALARSMHLLAREMKRQKLSLWAEVMASIRQMPWVDVFEPPCARLGERLSKEYPRTAY